jgi:uncharacterized membrane protein/glutaredoxin
MAKTARKKKSGRKEASRQIAIRSIPNWPLLGLALIGMALTAYLTATSWRGQALAGCPAGSGCDVVLNSRWSTLFGLPTSFWGFVVYSALASIAWIKRADTQWKWAWVLSLLGLFYSLYLTAISIFELKATCPYCLISLGLMAAILATTFYQRPREMPRFSWRPWLIKTLASGAVIVLVLHLHFAGIWGKSLGPEDPKLRALAEHLAKTDAKFYGASWCPHCTQQKNHFGSSASRLPYVECSPAGPKGPEATACKKLNIRTYPTWIINGQRREGVLSTDELAQYSGFEGVKP